MFKKLHLTPSTLRFGLSSVPPPINLRTPPPENYCTVPYQYLALVLVFLRAEKLNYKSVAKEI